MARKLLRPVDLFANVLMAKRKSSSDCTQQPAPKQTRARAPFRVARPASQFISCVSSLSSLSSPSPSGSWVTTSRVTKLRQTANGRLSQRKREKQSQTSTDEQLTLEDTTDGLSAYDTVQDTPDSTADVPDASMPKPKPKPKRKRNNTTSVSISFLRSTVLHTIGEPLQSKLKEWLPFRDSFLDELLRHDGHGDYLGSNLCGSCERDDGVIKCSNCFSGCLLRCRTCVLSAHQDHPLHYIEVCTDFLFVSHSANTMN
jgi:hypothetical protein